ncbi:uncharacterized protein LOC141655100 [Silene latifolia]|uniref:uncharacterized protein LOC141655100 n=1 Tax=Silene latifolia TaxID=37657 RepID=UPI003D77F4B7
MDPTCCRCKLVEETDLHALILCPTVKLIWECFGVDVDDEWSGVHNMEEWARLVVKRSDQTEASKKFILLWAIWNERNHVLHGGEPNNPSTIVDNALKYLESFAGLMREKKGNHGGCIAATNQWSPPPEGSWKVNVDAAIFNEKGCGMGVVIRDHEGSVGKARVKQVRAQWEVNITEAKAAFLGLQMARQMGIESVILESDSLVLVTLLKTRKVENSNLGNVVQGILRLSEEFGSCAFSFVKRNGNKAAHSMAHYSPLDYSTRIWVASCPELIADIVSADFMSSFS